MHVLRTAAIALVAVTSSSLFAPTVATAADTESEVCVLYVTESRTPPRKPNVFETRLDCGAEPTEEQDWAGRAVNNTMNLAGAVEVMVRLGYELETSSVRESYTGRQVFGVHVLVREAQADIELEEEEIVEEEMADDATDDTLPEAGEGTEPSDEDDVPDFSDDPDAGGIDIGE